MPRRFSLLILTQNILLFYICMLFPPAISSKYMNFKLLKDFLKIFPQIYIIKLKWIPIWNSCWHARVKISFGLLKYSSSDDNFSTLTLPCSQSQCCQFWSCNDKNNLKIRNWLSQFLIFKLLTSIATIGFPCQFLAIKWLIRISNKNKY